MKELPAILIVGLLTGCASYSDRGTGEGGREMGSKGYTVRCDATPANQPGCYSPPPSYSWNFMKNFHLKLGQN